MNTDDRVALAMAGALAILAGGYVAFIIIMALKS
jgi:hypothetical protein